LSGLGRFPGSGPRIRGQELLDEPEIDTTALRVALGNVERANRFIGGLRSIRRHLVDFAAGREDLTLLDVGVGNGAVPRRLASWLATAGTRLRWVGVDLHSRALRVAAIESAGGDSFGLVRADARALPFGDGSFDLATATLTLHHFDDSDCVRVLSEMARVSRMGVIVSDLERHPLHYLGARMLAETWWRGDPVTRHDAPVSVLRAFTPSELAELARRVPFGEARVRRHFPFRLVLEGRP
jgi:SAM-dependent methyltransferase